MRDRTCIVLLIFVSILSYGQDTLFFQKKKNTKKEYFIELNQYKVKIKPENDKKFWAYVADYNDSSLIVSAYTKSKEAKNKMKKLHLHFIDSIQRNNLTLTQQDSAYLLLQDKLKAVQYSTKKELLISSIKKITVNNYFRPDKKKMMQTVDGFGYAALGGMLLIGPTLMAINTQFTPIFAFFYFYGIVIIPVVIIAETKQINLKRTWNIVNIKSH